MRNALTGSTRAARRAGIRAAANVVTISMPLAMATLRAIDCRNRKEQATHGPREQPGCRETDAHARNHPRGCISKHQSKDAHRAGANGDTDAKLACSPYDAVRDRSIEAGRGEEQGEAAKDRRHRADEAFAEQCTIDLVSNGMDVKDRDCAIQLLDGRPDRRGEASCAGALRTCRTMLDAHGPARNGTNAIRSGSSRNPVYFASLQRRRSPSQRRPCGCRRAGQWGCPSPK